MLAGIALAPPAAAQVTINSAQTSTQTLETLCGGCASPSTATITSSGSITASSGNGLVGTTNAWSVLNQGSINATTDGAQGIRLAGQAGTVTNAGTIAGGRSGGGAVYLLAGGTVTNQSGGAIRGGVNAFGINSSGGALTITNQSGATISALVGIRSDGPTTITNAGTITGGDLRVGNAIAQGEGIRLTQGGTVINQAGGTISGGSAVSISGGTGSVTNQAGGLIDVFNSAANGPAGVILFAGGTVTNAGTIRATGGAYGVSLTGGVAQSLSAGSLTNSGLIDSAGDAVVNANGTGTSVTNSGTIRSSGARGIRNDAGTIIISNLAGGVISGAYGMRLANGTVTNAGTIAGTAGVGVQFTGTSGGTVTNSGTISGSAGTAIQFGNGPNLLTLQTGSSIIGNVVGGSATNSLVLQGASANIGQFQNFTSVQVDSGTLTGVGTVAGNVSNLGGTIAPGSSGSPGTLTLTGNYTQSSSGTLASQVSPTTASRVTAGGTASLAGGLTMTVVPGVFTSGTKYRVLSANSGVSGTFGTVTSSAPLLTFTPEYTATAVDVAVSYNSLSGFTSNGSLGAALDKLVGNPAFASLFTALSGLTTAAELRDALNKLNGSVQNVSGLSSSAQSNNQVVTGSLAQQVAAARGGKTAALDETQGSGRVQLAALDPAAALAQGPGPAPRPFVTTTPWTAWLTGFGVLGSTGGNASASAVSYATGGTALGADYRLDPAFLLGAFVSYSGTSTSVEGRPGSGSTDSYAGGLYGSWTSGPLYVDGLLGYAYGDSTLKRTIAFSGFAPVTARARTNSDQFFSAIEVGRSYDFIGGSTIAPFVGIQASVIDQAAFTETGGGALNLAVRADTVSSARTQLGARVSKDVDMGEGKLVNLGVKLGWAHELSDTGTATTATFASAPGATFSVPGAQRGRDTALVGVGAAVKMHPNVNIFARYDGDLNGTDDAHAVMGGVRLTW